MLKVLAIETCLQDAGRHAGNMGTRTTSRTADAYMEGTLGPGPATSASAYNGVAPEYTALAGGQRSSKD
jgi:hypothetical protein